MKNKRMIKNDWLEEVWQIKENLYEKNKNLSTMKYMNKISKKALSICKEIDYK